MGCIGINSNCNKCNNFVATTAVTVSGTNLVLTIPSNNYRNDSNVCICVAQALPSGVTSALTVVVQIGTNQTLYPLRTACGHNVYGDQIFSRRMYCTKVATDSGTFVIRNSKCLPCTSAIMLGSLPSTQVTESTQSASATDAVG